MNILAHASDIAEWDSVLLNRYHPLYTSIPSTPTIMEESNQAKLSLQDTCKGLFKQLTFARDLLEFAIKVFGRDREIDMGSSITYPTMNTSMLTGFYTKNLDDMDGALSYAEAQLSELLLAAYFGAESVLEFEREGTACRRPYLPCDGDSGNYKDVLL